MASAVLAWPGNLCNHRQHPDASQFTYRILLALCRGLNGPEKTTSVAISPTPPFPRWIIGKLRARSASFTAMGLSRLRMLPGTTINDATQ